MLGRYDRPWAPRREVFGVIRYMRSENTARRLRLRQYLATYGPQPALIGLERHEGESRTAGAKGKG